MTVVCVVMVSGVKGCMHFFLFWPVALAIEVRINVNYHRQSHIASTEHFKSDLW